MLDPEIGIDFARMVHGAQQFAWHEPVVAGDEITTEAELTGTLRARRAELLRVPHALRQPARRAVCEGTWTNIVR